MSEAWPWAPADAAHCPPKPIRLLVVDDDPAVCRLITRIFGKETTPGRRFVVREVASIEKALPVLDRGEADCVVLDLKFKEERLQGRDLLVKLRREHKRVPVIVV
ncbi:MAG: response regulator, partial [Elusimicrobia bacterium]|nr:response regulator [Elusimicrobiota bacterium]